MIAACEATVLGVKAGLDAGTMLDAINASYDRSRLSHMGTQRAMEKRLRGDFNERFGGAETGFLGRAEERSRGQLGETLALNEDQRNMALAGARERAEELVRDGTKVLAEAIHAVH